MRFERVDGDAADCKRNVLAFGDGSKCLNVGGSHVGNDVAEPVDVGHATVEGPLPYLGLPDLQFFRNRLPGGHRLLAFVLA